MKSSFPTVATVMTQRPTKSIDQSDSVLFMDQDSKPLDRDNGGMYHRS